MSAARNVPDRPVPALPPTVLVVDDEILVRMVIAAYLRDCGFDVVEAGSADEAVRVLEAGLRIDIVFSDVSMPGSLDGFGLARWVRRERPELKVILTSGAVRTAKDATDFSAHGPIVAKPYNHANLASPLRALLVR
jgi:two-component system, response regulator PdtaR